MVLRLESKMASLPLITVIITTCKRPVEILDRAVKSVLAQDYSNYEVIVVNDYPEDKILVQKIGDCLSSYSDTRVHYVVQNANGGACQARNVGIRKATGEYIAFLDDDDEWMPDKLSKQLAGFTSEKIGAVSCDFLDVGRNKGKGRAIVVRTGDDDRCLVEALLWRNCVGGCSEPMIRASVLEDIGGFDESLLASQDYDLWMRIAIKYEIAFIHLPLVKRYYSEDAITGNFAKKMSGFEIFQKKNKELYKKYPDALNYRYAQKIEFCLMHKKFAKSIQFFAKAFRVKPLSKYNIIEPVRGIVKLLRMMI
jgi:glycosyltransferase involved in cell wall biosynthesis